jgi:hypothetical protein
MSERKINLEEILKTIAFEESEKGNSSSFSVQEMNVINLAMKEACRQVLELAAENADTKYLPLLNSNESIEVVDKQSILNTINQVE